MKIIQCEQNSPEWYAARCGIPSASSFDKIVTTTGMPSKQREKYLYQLAGEVISGKSEESFQSAAMIRGHEMEQEARQFYELTNGCEIKQVGFCIADEVRVGCSPDGLVIEDGGLEIKNPLMATHVSYLLDGILPTEYYTQVQGNLLVTGRAWWDFISYSRGLKSLVVRVEPDKVFHQALAYQLRIFCNELETIVQKIK